MSKFLAALGLAMLLWLPQHANANPCTIQTSDGQPGRFRIPPVTWDGSFNPDAFAVGGVIQRITFYYDVIENPYPGGNNGAYNCVANHPPSPGNYVGNIDRRGTTGAYQLMNIPEFGGLVAVYPSTVPGIGLHIRYAVNSASSWAWPQSVYMDGPGYMMATSPRVTIALVKTGPITRGGVLSGEVAGEFLRDHGNQQIISYLWTGGVPVKPQIPTCEPTVTDKVVDLGSMDAGSVTDDGYSDAVTFNMDLVCSGGVPVDKTQQMSVTFTDATDPTNTTDKLSLTAASTGAGVKVQLLSGGTPITFGPEPTNGLSTPNSIALGAIKNGTYSYPFAARYVQTGSVSAGTANAAATFTLTYQ